MLLQPMHRTDDELLLLVLLLQLVMTRLLRPPAGAVERY